MTHMETNARARGLSRRRACLVLGGAPILAAADLVLGGASRVRGAQAEEATAAALASAEEQYAAVQAQIDDLAWQQEQLSGELSDTLDAMEAKNNEIAGTQAQIEQTQDELAACQDELAVYVSDAYKNGRATELDVLLNSSTYEELFANMYYLTKINDAETELIERTRSVAQQLSDEKAELEAQYAELEDLRAQQEDELSQIEDRQNETYALLSQLGDEVQALTEQYNQELIAQAQAAAEAEAARAAAQEAQGGGDSGGSGGISYGGGSASAVVNACYSTPSPGAGYCAGWVTNVFVNAGVGAFYGDACDMYASYCYSSDRGSLQPGMIVAVSTWTGTSAGRIYGHVGIYVGGGTVMDNIGYIRSIDIDSWVGTYGTTVTPRWGWLGGVALS